jgi:hypothetical protein
MISSARPIQTLPDIVTRMARRRPVECVLAAREGGQWTRTSTADLNGGPA